MRGIPGGKPASDRRRLPKIAFTAGHVLKPVGTLQMVKKGELSFLHGVVSSRLPYSLVLDK